MGGWCCGTRSSWRWQGAHHQPRAPTSAERALLLTALPIRGSGIGALPFFLIPPDQLKGGLVGAANAVAAGVTLAASFGEPRAFGRPFGRLYD